MIPKSWWHSRDVWGGPVAIIAMSGVLLAVEPLSSRWLAFDRGHIAAGQWWRLCTANWVHLGFWHWLFNALSLLLWIGICPRRLRAQDWLLRLVLIGTAMSLGLYAFDPSLQRYVGLSGFIYGIFLLDLGHDALVGRDGFAWLCLIFLLARVGWEDYAGAPGYEVRLIGGQVVAASHISGMVSAATYGIAGYLIRRAGSAWTTRHTGDES